MENKKVLEKLHKIQTELKVNKNQYNSFGGYYYRSCEDILEAVKELLRDNKCILTQEDALIQIGDRYYIESSVILTCTETGDSISTKGFAREEESKKGMDGSQITGTASSYARKYALNGLFCIDDAKDSDATNTHGKTQTGLNNTKPTKKQSKDKPLTKDQLKYKIKVLINGLGLQEDYAIKKASYFKNKEGKEFFVTDINDAKLSEKWLNAIKKNLENGLKE